MTHQTKLSEMSANEIATVLVICLHAPKDMPMKFTHEQLWSALIELVGESVAKSAVSVITSRLYPEGWDTEL